MEQACSVAATLKIVHLLALILKIWLTPKDIRSNVYSCHLAYSHRRESLSFTSSASGGGI